MINRACIASLLILACVACSERGTTSADASAPMAGEGTESGADAPDRATSGAQTLDDKLALEEAAAYSAQLHEESARAAEEEALVAAIQAQVEQQERGTPPTSTQAQAHVQTPASSGQPATPMTEEEALIAAIQAQVEQQQASGKKNPPPAD